MNKGLKNAGLPGAFPGATRPPFHTFSQVNEGEVTQRSPMGLVGP